jgi:hypothetical protein
MPDFFDTSRIADNDAHWEALARRIADHAMRRLNATGVGWLTQWHAGVVAAGLLLVAALFALAGSADGLSTASLTAVSTQALAPIDDAGRAIILRDQPPAIGALLFSSRPTR